MEITGRLVADATVRAVSEEKNVTGFRVAVNRLCGLYLLAHRCHSALSDERYVGDFERIHDCPTVGE